MKATHYATCQVCGSKQKYTQRGVAKHGYTVQWGFFSGICDGSDSVAWEIDNAKAVQAVAHQQHAINIGNETIAELNSTSDYAWVSFYHRDPVRGRSTRRSVKVDASAIYIGGHAAYAHVDGEPQEIVGFYELHAFLNDFNCQLTVEHVIRFCNSRRAKGVERENAQRQQYIDWQTKRIISWAPAELEPVAAEVVLEPVFAGQVKGTLTATSVERGRVYFRTAAGKRGWLGLAAWRRLDA